MNRVETFRKYTIYMAIFVVFCFTFICMYNKDNACIKDGNADLSALDSSTTYYKNGSSYYTLSGQVQHYHCTNSSHSGSNDYTTSSVSGTCYTVCGYYNHVCSSHNGSHSCYSASCPTCGGDGTLNESYFLGSIVSWDPCTRCGGSWGDWGWDNHGGSGVIYVCSHCGDDWSYNNTDTCSSHIYYTCSYCGDTWSYNNAEQCWSRPWSEDHGHNIATSHIEYTYQNIDTGEAVISNTSYSTASGYTIAFNGNGATSGSMTPQYFLVGHSQAINANQYSRTGCTFVGWNTNTSSSSVTYGNNQVITNFNSGSGGTLYAVWQVPKPIINGSNSFVYSGSAQSPTINNYNDTAMTRSGDYGSKTNVGNYSITYALKPGYSWTDGSTSNVTLNWSIVKATLTKPTIQTTTFEYNSSERTITINGFNSTTMAKTGTESSINVNTYSVVFSLRDTVNYQWNDGTTANFTLTWKIDPIYLSKPTIANTSAIYNGSLQNAPTITGYNSGTMNKSGTESAINATTYTITISLKDTTNYRWNDNTTTAVNLSWTISPKSLNNDGSMSLNDCNYKTCPACSGTGKEKCSTCGGDGKVTGSHNWGGHNTVLLGISYHECSYCGAHSSCNLWCDNGYLTANTTSCEKVPCSRCGASGYLNNDCSTCAGRGIVYYKEYDGSVAVSSVNNSLNLSEINYLSKETSLNNKNNKFDNICTLNNYCNIDLRYVRKRFDIKFDY